MCDRKSITAKKTKVLMDGSCVDERDYDNGEPTVNSGKFGSLVFGFGQSTRSVQWVQGGWYVVLKMSSRVCSKK